VSASAPSGDFARRVRIAAAISTALGAFVGFVVLLMLAGVLGAKDWVALGAGFTGVVVGAGTGWWFVARNDPSLRLGPGVAVVVAITAVLSIPSLVFAWPLAIVAAGMAGLLGALVGPRSS
jgi:hypothetical protein